MATEPSFSSYTLPDIDFNKLDRYSYFPFLEDIASFQTDSLRPERLALQQASFLIRDAQETYEVSVKYLGETYGQLLFSCSCQQGANFCKHEKIAFNAILKQDDIRAFFSRQSYGEQLKRRLKQQSVAGISLQDDLVELCYQDTLVSLRPKNPQMLLLDSAQLQAFTDSTPTIYAHAEGMTACLVFRKHKFYHHLQIQLYQAAKTRDGRLKNPVEAMDCKSELWKSQDRQESLFYAALKDFEQLSSLSKEEELRAALLFALSNPKGLACYLHLPEKSAHVTAASLMPIEVFGKLDSLQIRISREGEFHRVEAYIQHRGTYLPLDDFQWELQFFLRMEAVMYYIHSPAIAQFLRLFPQHSHKVIVHEKQIAAFQISVLSTIESYVEIIYTDIPVLPTTAVDSYYEQGEVCLYLEESEDFINLLPVLRYGDIEVAIRSKRQHLVHDAQGVVSRLPRQRQREEEVLEAILQAHPYFEEQLGEIFPYFYLHHSKFLDPDWFLPTFARWRALGFEIIGFNELKRHKLSSFTADISLEVRSGINWFNADLSIRFGKRRASLKALTTSMRNRSNQILLDDGSYGILPEAWLARLRRLWDAAAAKTEAEESISLGYNTAQFEQVESLFEASELQEDTKVKIDIIRDKILLNNKAYIPVPNNLQATLRPYQQQGYQWIYSLASLGLGGILADDMGLGKSIQALAFLLRMAPNKRTLLVVPTTLIFNWKAECAKFAPSLRVLDLQELSSIKNLYVLEEYDLIICSYARLNTAINQLKNFTFDYLVLDESQQIKNPDSQRYKAVSLLQATSKFALSGTPLENNSMDLYAQLSIVCPGLLGSRQYFKDVYTTPIDAFDDYKRRQQLQEKIAPFMLRRTKDVVLQELPPKVEQVVFCEMHAEQRAIYERYEREFREFIDAHTGESIRRSPMHVLKGLLKLRQICDSPALLSEREQAVSTHAAKIDYLLREVEEKQHQHKIVIFSQFVQMLEAIKVSLETKAIKTLLLTGNTKNRESVIQQFQQDPDSPILLISLKTGGTGLNLTAASILYLVEPWWNPAVEAQAIDRIYRMGQHKAVTAIRLITPNSIEEKMMQLKADKRFIADELVQAIMENPQ